MSKLNWLVEKSRTSAFHLWLLNRAMLRVVPFNSPHRLKILQVNHGSTKILLPYQKRNLNHLGGIHACALATLCEFTAGFCLLSRLGEKQFRFILKSLRMEYHFQGKSDVYSDFRLDEDFLQQKILGPLENSDAVFIMTEVAVNDMSGNHICTGFAEWQLKKWEKVTVKPE